MKYESIQETAQNGDLEDVKQHLQQGADVNAKDCVFRTISATHSDSNRPPVPIEFGRAFRFKSATP